MICKVCSNWWIIWYFLLNRRKQVKKFIIVNDICEVYVCGEQVMFVVLCVSIIILEVCEVVDLLGFIIIECDELFLVMVFVFVSVLVDKIESQCICEIIIVQLLEGQFIESLVVQLMEKVMKEKQLLEQGVMQLSFKLVIGKGGIKVIDGSSVKFGCFDGVELYCVGLIDFVIGDDGSSMVVGFMQWDNVFFLWILNYDEIDMVLEGELYVCYVGEIMIVKVGDVMFILKGFSIEFGMIFSVKFLYVVWLVNW